MTNDLSFTGGSPRAYTEINLGGGGGKICEKRKLFINSLYSQMYSVIALRSSPLSLHPLYTLGWNMSTLYMLIKKNIANFSIVIFTLLKGYPQRMRLQRRLDGNNSDYPPTLMILVSNDRLHSQAYHLFKLNYWDLRKTL